MATSAVLLLAYGTVEPLDRMAEFLADVMEGRPPTPGLVAEMRRRYEAVGGSPLTRLTFEQARAVEAELARRGRLRPVFVGMRHWEPRIRQAVEAIAAAGARQATAIVMAPHYSALSIGRYRRRLDEAIAAIDANIEVRWVERWWHQPKLLDAHERRLREALARERGEARPCWVIFTAHSLPERIRAMGDPYEQEVLAHARRLADRVALSDWSFAFQSAGASAGPWLGPSIGDELRRLAAAGVRRALVCPIGFVCDNVEILYDLDIEARQLAADLGMDLARVESLNAHPLLAEAVADAIESA